MNQKQHFTSFFFEPTTQFWDNAKIDKTQKYKMEDMFYIQTSVEKIPCNLRLKKKFLIMEQDDVQKQHNTSIENAALELITSDLNEDQGVRISKGAYSFEFFGKIKGLFDQLKKYCIQYNFKQRYNIIRLIAKGTFANIYLAECKFSQKQFAVKCFEKRFLQNDKDKKNIMREMQILRLMNHKQLLSINEVFENKNFIYFVQELLEGGDLHDYLEKSEKLSELKVGQIIYNLLNGVQYMHSQGVIHRDIKPENLILRQKGNLSDIVLGDFGLADFYKFDGNYLYKRCGTPGYVAPEILRYQPYDYRVDIYSIGVIMYILLAGRRPFNAKNNQQVIALNELGEINYNDIDCSSEALSLVKKLLESEPEKRISIVQAKQHPFFIASQHEKKQPKLKLDVKSTQNSDHLQISPLLTSRPINRSSMLNNFTIHTPRQLPRLSNDVKSIVKTEQNESQRFCISRQSLSRVNLRQVNSFLNSQQLLIQH